MHSVYRALLGVGLAAALAAADHKKGHPAPGCKKFSEIYAGGKELCENMWDGAFEYTTDEEKAYTMWWEYGENPNKLAAAALGEEPNPATCKLSGDYYHKKVPGPEEDSNHECWPWKKSACCEDTTVASRDVIQDGYGAEFHWDRCGPMSQACERFFVKEACLYECEPLTGHYRKFPAGANYNGSATGGTDNTWQISKMPIKASFCDNWHHACKDDMFCSAGGGSFWDCAAIYEAHDDVVEKLGGGAIAAIVIAVVVAVLALGFVGVLIMRERKGQPVFVPLSRDSARSDQVGEPNNV